MEKFAKKDGHFVNKRGEEGKPCVRKQYPLLNKITHPPGLPFPGGPVRASKRACHCEPVCAPMSLTCHCEPVRTPMSLTCHCHASAHTGVAISYNLGDCQEVNCPQGKRDHPGVRRLRLLAMTRFLAGITCPDGRSGGDRSSRCPWRQRLP